MELVGVDPSSVHYTNSIVVNTDHNINLHVPNCPLCKPSPDQPPPGVWFTPPNKPGHGCSQGCVDIFCALTTFLALQQVATLQLLLSLGPVCLVPLGVLARNVAQLSQTELLVAAQGCQQPIPVLTMPAKELPHPGVQNHAGTAADCAKSTSALVSLLADVGAFLGFHCPTKEQVRQALVDAHPAYDLVRVLDKGLTKLSDRQRLVEQVCEQVEVLALPVLQIEPSQAVRAVIGVNLVLFAHAQFP